MTCSPGVIVFIPGRAFNVIVGAGNVFQMDNVPPGTYELHIERNGLMLLALQVTVADTLLDLGSISVVDTQNDAANCGACGNVCAPTQSCVQGACTGAVCGAGQTMCANNTCVDTSTDSNNCGQCGRVCGGGSVCSNGSCSAPPQCSSPSDCPGSDTVCAARTCVQGVCGFNFAPAGTVSPNNQTTGDCQALVCDGSGNLISTADNTDVPQDDGNQCTQDVCTNGVPTHPNMPAGTACNQNGGDVCNSTGQCVPSGNSCTMVTWYRDLDADGYGTAQFTTQSCTQPPGYAANASDCDDANSSVHPGAPEVCDGRDNNCNAQIDEGGVCNSVSSCGTVGHFCSFANAAAQCVNGQCAIAACDPGYNDCNGTASDGCETDIMTSFSNCGACGRSCSAGQVCANGLCSSANFSAGAPMQISSGGQ